MYVSQKYRKNTINSKTLKKLFKMIQKWYAHKYRYNKIYNAHKYRYNIII